MSNIAWNDGQLINIKPGDTATCSGGLNVGQLYALFFYNSSGHDANTDVTIIWSNLKRPVTVTVPGTTNNEGLAALCFVSGDDTNTVSASVNALGSGSGGDISAFIGSVKMPVDTQGINNESLPLDGTLQSFNKFTRFHAVPASHWYQAAMQSNINQFISVQFQEESAVVNILNAVAEPKDTIAYTGSTKSQVTVKQIENQTTNWYLQGDGTQVVWINADSAQNSSDAKISVQSSVGEFEAFNS